MLSSWKLIDLLLLFFFCKWQGAYWLFILIRYMCFNDLVENETSFLRVEVQLTLEQCSG